MKKFYPTIFVYITKLHIGKELYIVLTAFLPINNNITEVRLAKHFFLVSRGRMVKAKKRFIQMSVQSHCPQTPKNQFCHVVQGYFRSMEIMDSNEGTEKEPNMLLLSVYRDKLIPGMNTLVKQYSQCGTTNRYGKSGRRWGTTSR